MADDIASLGIAVDTSGLAAGTAALKNFNTTAQSTAQTVGQVQARFQQFGQQQQAQASATNTASQTTQRAMAQTSAMIQGMTAAANQNSKSWSSLVAGMSAAGQAATSLGQQALPRAANANQQFTRSAQAARFELINLSRQLQDVFVGFKSGQSPFTILAQQGPQIFDVFQSSSLGARGFAQSLLSLVTPTRLLVAGVVGVTAAVALMIKGWKDSESQFLTLSERVDTTISKLHELEQAAAIKGIDEDEFIKGIAGFGDAVSAAKDKMGELFGLLRVNGQVAGDLESTLFKVADLVANAADGAQRYRIVQQAGLPPTAEWVRFLGQGSQAIRDATAEATKFGQDESLIRSAREFDDALNKAWKDFNVGWKSLAVTVLETLKTWTNAAGDFVGTLLGISAVGSGKTRGDELGDTGGGNPLKVRVGTTTKTRDQINNELNLERQRIQLLGQTATAAQVARAREIELLVARNNGVDITDKEIDKLKGLAGAQETVNRMQETVSALGDAATAAEKYAAQIEALKVKLDEGRISQDTFNRAVATLNPTTIALKDSLAQFTDGIVQGMLRGKDLTDALGNSLKSVAATASSAAITNLIKDDLASAATSGLIAAGSALASLFFGSDDKSKENIDAAAQAARDLQARQQQIAEAQQRAAEFSERASIAAQRSGSFLSSLQKFDFDAQRQFDEESKRAGSLAINELIAAITAERKALIDQAISDARGILSGNQQSDVQKRLKEIADAADDMTVALTALGSSTEEVATLVSRATEKLRSDFLGDLTRQLNEAQGRSFINDITDLIEAIAQNRQDAAALGLSTSLVDEVFQAKAQEIVDGAGLVGSAFDALIAQFPELSGVVHEATGNLEEIINQLNQAGRSIVDYVNSLLAGTSSTLSPQARFNQAQATYNATLALAQASDIDALNRITTDAENLRQAAQALFGSGSGFQSIFNQIVSQLLALPAVTDTIDPSTQAIVNAITGTTNAIAGPGGTTASVLVGNNLLTSANALNTTANTLSTTANTLITNSNSLLDAIRGLQTTANTTLSAQLSQINLLATINQNITTLVHILAPGDSPGFVNVHVISGAASGGWVPGFDSGGTIPGVFTGRDNVNANLMPGEFVVRRSTALANSNWLPEFNRTGRIPSNDNGDLASLMAALLSELERNTRVTAAAAERIGAPLDSMNSSQREAVRESKRMAA